MPEITLPVAAGGPPPSAQRAHHAGTTLRDHSYSGGPFIAHRARQADGAGIRARPGPEHRPERVVERPMPHEPQTEQAPGRRGRGPIALILHNRRYPAGPVMLELVAAGYSTSERLLDQDGVDIMQHLQPDLLVCALDPGEPSDLALLRALSKRTRAFLAVITPGPGSAGFLECLKAGADICFAETDPVELFGAQVGVLGRVRSRDRRFRELPETIAVGEMSLDAATLRLRCHDRVARLGPMEARILARLAAVPATVLTASELLEAADGRPHLEHEAARIIKVHIRRIRQKFEAIGLNPHRIINVRGVGYMLTDANFIAAGDDIAS